ncbi:hypothetical protein ROZALSC1DRAFT_30453, partial [Rozella allomycis CSF55]
TPDHQRINFRDKFVQKRLVGVIDKLERKDTVNTTKKIKSALGELATSSLTPRTGSVREKSPKLERELNNKENNDANAFACERKEQEKVPLGKWSSFIYAYSALFLIYAVLFYPFEIISNYFTFGETVASIWYPNCGVNLIFFLYFGPLFIIPFMCAILINLLIFFPINWSLGTMFLHCILKASCYLIESLILNRVIQTNITPRTRKELFLMLLTFLICHIAAGFSFFTMFLIDFRLNLITPSSIFGWVLGDVGGILNVLPLFYFVIFPDFIEVDPEQRLQHWIDFKNLLRSKQFWLQRVQEVVMIVVVFYLALGILPQEFNTEKASDRLYVTSSAVMYYVFQYGRKGAAFSLALYNIGLMLLISVLKLKVDIANVQMFINATGFSCLQLIIERDVAFRKAVVFSLENHELVLKLLEKGEQFGNVVI